MALARLKKMMGYAGGTPDVSPDPNARWASAQSYGLHNLFPGIPAVAPAENFPPRGSVGPPAAPGIRPGYGATVVAPPAAPAAPAAPLMAGPVVPASGPLPAVATPAQIARWGVGAPGGDHVGVGPGNARPMFAPPPAQPSSWQTDDPHQIREAHRLGPGEAPAMDYPSGPGPDVIRAGHMTGRGIPLTAQIALMTKPAAEKSALDLYNGAQTERDTTIAAALKAAGGNASDPAFIRVAQQADAKLALTHHEILGGQQLNLMQMMNSGMLSNPGGYGFGQ